MPTKFSQFPSESDIYASDSVVGLANGANARFTFANILLLIKQNLSNFFIAVSQKGAVEGVASLDSTGKVPSTQLPPIPSDASDIEYDNTQSGLTATDVQEAIDELAQGGGGGGTAASISYDNTGSGLSATDVQDAIDELAAGGGGGGPSPYTSNPAMDGTASPGSSANYARGDHVHPTDTSRASASDVASLDARYTDNTIWQMNTNANDFKTSGFYAMGSGNLNVPMPWGILCVLGPISDTIEQEYRYMGNIWNREYRNGSWSQWALAGNQSQPTYVETQLAYVETGTTASQNYTAGQYISWNGVLYTADTAIASGATFYTSGGNKNLTECVGGGFNYLKSRLAIVSGSANAGGGISSVAYPSGFNKTNCTVLRCFVDIYNARWPVDTVGYAILYDDRIELHNEAGGASSTIGTIYALLFKL